MIAYTLRIKGLQAEAGTVRSSDLLAHVENLHQSDQLDIPFDGVVQAERMPVDVSEIWGQWPGDESVEELLAEL